MAIETVVIKITGDSKDINKTIDQLEKLGKVDRQNAKSFKKTSEQNQKNIKKTESSLGGLQKQALALGATLIGAFAIQQAIGSAINILRDFEKELSTLQSITGSTAKEMEFFSKAAREIGKSTLTSATEVVKAFTLIGSAQPELLKNKDALASVTEQALILSKAAGIDTVAAAEALTGAMNQFGAAADDAARFTDIFATSQQKGSSFIQQTAEALKNSGAAANAAGISFETTNAAIQALAKGSLLGGEAGTALRGILIKLSSQTDDQINPSLVGLGKTIDVLEERNLSLAEATKLVGQEGATGLLTLIKQNKTFKELDGNLNEVGNALNQMAINTDNLDGSIEEVNLAFEEFVLSLNEGEGNLAGFIRGIVDLGREFLELLTILAKGKDAFDAQQDAIFAAAIQAREFQSNIRGTNEELRANVLASIKSKIATVAAAKEEANRVKTIGDLKKELAELKKAQDALIPGSQELLINQTRVREIQELLKNSVQKSLAPFAALNKLISDLRKELQDQALAGDVSKETIQELDDALDKLAEAEVTLKLAITDTLPLLEAQRLELEKISDAALIPFTPIEDAIADAEKLADARIDAINKVAEVEASLFRIAAQRNLNRLIAIDNREIAELRALDNLGLGEEELAKRQLAIQEEADEERAKILTKQAKADKIAAIFQATINTAIAVSRALITSAALAIFIAALGAAEIATIAAQPIPTFHEGKKSELKPGEINAIILKSESVIPPQASAQNKGLIDSIIDDNLQDYVFKHYQLPLLKEMGATKNIFDDRNITGKQSKTNRLLAESNALTKAMIRTFDSANHRRSWG